MSSQLSTSNIEEAALNGSFGYGSRPLRQKRRIPIYLKEDLPNPELLPCKKFIIGLGSNLDRPSAEKCDLALSAIYKSLDRKYPRKAHRYNPNITSFGGSVSKIADKKYIKLFGDSILKSVRPELGVAVKDRRELFSKISPPINQRYTSMSIKKPKVDESSFVMMKSNGFRTASQTCHSFVKPPKQGDLQGQMAYIQEMIKRRNLTHSHQPPKDGVPQLNSEMKPRVQSADIFKENRIIHFSARRSSDKNDFLISQKTYESNDTQNSVEKFDIENIAKPQSPEAKRAKSQTPSNKENYLLISDKKTSQLRSSVPQRKEISDISFPRNLEKIDEEQSTIRTQKYGGTFRAIHVSDT